MEDKSRPSVFRHPPSTIDYRLPSGLASLLIHAGLIGLLFVLAGGRPSRFTATQRPLRFTSLVAPYFGPKASQGGGGGGGRSPLPASLGQAPRFARTQFVPPSPTAAQYKLLMEPTLVGPPDVHLPPVDSPLWGDPTALAGPPSPGPGCCGSIGSGRDHGIGSEDGGSGVGPGPGGGIRAIVGGLGVSPPVPLYKVEPEYSEEARKAKFQGTVVLEIVIDERGNPTNFRILNPLGLGLDEKAIEAVKQWRFRPATKNGKPVAVVARIDVTFRLL